MLATHDFVSEDDFRDIERIVGEEYLPKSRLWVAEDAEDQLLGFMGMTGSSIDSLFVDPDRHGQGIGRRLIDHARAISPSLTVEVNEQNPAATAFYERLGFRRTGRSELDSGGRPYPILHLALSED